MHVRAFADALLIPVLGNLSPNGTIRFIFPVRLQVGNGMIIRFCEDIWIGGVPLTLAFPRFYYLSSEHNSPIFNFYTWGRDLVY